MDDIVPIKTGKVRLVWHFIFCFIHVCESASMMYVLGPLDNYLDPHDSTLLLTLEKLDSLLFNDQCTHIFKIVKAFYYYYYYVGRLQWLLQYLDVTTDK